MLLSEARIDMTVSAPQLGKSLVLGLWLLAGAWRDGGRVPWPSWWTDPTYSQAKDGFARYIVAPALSAGILRDSDYTLANPIRAKLTNGSVLEARSWDNAKGLFGPTVARIGVNEFGLLTQESWAALSSRVTETAVRGYGYIRGVGNVTEIGGVAESLYRAAESGKPGYHARTWTWRDRASAAPCACGIDGLEIADAHQHGDRCERGIYLRELEARRAVMSANHFRQLYEAEWIDWSSLPVYTFERAVHANDQLLVSPFLPLQLTCDFNVDPMCWIVGQADGHSAWDLDEIVIPGGATTEAACAEFVRRYPDHKAGVEVYGDASGKARKTSASRTDYEIIRARLEPKYPRFTMRVPAVNPSVADRVNAVNALMRSASGDVRYGYHPRCTTLATDWARVSWKPGTREIDKSNRSLTHASDASSYRLAYLFPISGQRAASIASADSGFAGRDSMLSEVF